jgi:hypothetical protein
MSAQTECLVRSPLSVGMAAICLTALLGLAGCGPVLKKGTPLSTVQEEDMLAAVGPYRLQQGDQLEVHHILDADYSAIVIVAPDGKISVPGIAEPVDARGHTISELTATLNGLYQKAEVFNKPFFSLNLRSFGSLQVFVGGEVQRPGYLELVGGDRYIMQVLRWMSCSCRKRISQTSIPSSISTFARRSRSLVQPACCTAIRPRPPRRRRRQQLRRGENDTASDNEASVQKVRRRRARGSG